MIWWASPVAQRERTCLSVQEMWASFLGQKDPLEKEMTTHASVLVFDRLWSMESQRVGHNPNLATSNNKCHLLVSCLLLLFNFKAWHFGVLQTTAASLLPVLSKLRSTGKPPVTFHFSRSSFYLFTVFILQKQVIVRCPVIAHENKEMPFCGLGFLHVLIQSPPLFQVFIWDAPTSVFIAFWSPCWKQLFYPFPASFLFPSNLKTA